MGSLKFESKLYAMVKDKMEEMQQHNMSWIEVQFLKKSLDILCECRRTLMYTYVFAYYLRKNNQSAIFEDNQKDLESATEHLSEYLRETLVLRTWWISSRRFRINTDIAIAEERFYLLMFTRVMKRSGGTILRQTAEKFRKIWKIPADESYSC